MTEIDYIRCELEKTEHKKDEELEKYLRLSIFLNKDARKWEKEFLKKDFSELKDLKKKIKEIKKNLPKKKEKWEAQLLSERLSEESRQQLSQDVQKANEILAEIHAIEDKVNKQIAHLKKLSTPIAIFETNITLTILFFILGVLSWFIGYGIKQWVPDYFWIVTVSIVGIICLFLAWKIFYLRYYCRKIEATGQIFIIVYSLKLTNALLLALIPYCGLCFCLKGNQYFYIVPILIICAIKTGASIYDFCSASKFFDSAENIITLLISILITVVIAISVVDNWFVLLIVKWLLAIISLLLTILMLKKCMLDKVSLDNFSDIYSFVVLLLATIIVSCFTIYLMTWKKEVNADQSLFTAMMGIYAAILGGAITLGGVAWTIRRQDEIKNEEEKKKYRPFILQISDVNEDIHGFPIEIKRIEKFNEVFNNYQNHHQYKVPDILLKNTNNTDFLMYGVKINDDIYKFDTKAYIEKDKIFGIVLHPNILTISNELKGMSIVVEDLLGNMYKIPMKLEIEKRLDEDTSKICVLDVKITDIGWTCDIDEEDCNAKY